MTTPQTQDSQGLSRQYFAYPETWRFNSPDFYLFYYALGALMSVLLILFLLILLVSSRPPAEVELTQNLPPSPPSAPASAPIAAASATPKPVVSAVASASPSAAASLKPVEPANDALISAEQQPSYALRAESYARLRDDASLSQTDRRRATQAYQRYNVLAQQAQNRLENALDGIGKDRFTVSIRQLQALIKEGEVLGDVYLQAQEELPKAYYKKIDYFMLKGQISNASRALGDAKAAGIESETLTDYESKIKNLMKVSR